MSTAILASMKDRLKRAELCHSCEHYRRVTRQCRKCGCIINLKVMIANSVCPIGKWNEVKPGNDAITQFQQKIWNNTLIDPTADQK